MDNRDLRDEDRFIGVEEDLAVYRYLNELQYDREPFVNPFPKIKLKRGRPKHFTPKPDTKPDTKPSRPGDDSKRGGSTKQKERSSDRDRALQTEGGRKASVYTHPYDTYAVNESSIPLDVQERALDIHRMYNDFASMNDDAQRVQRDLETRELRVKNTLDGEINEDVVNDVYKGLTYGQIERKYKNNLSEADEAKLNDFYSTEAETNFQGRFKTRMKRFDWEKTYKNNHVEELRRNMKSTRGINMTQEDAENHIGKIDHDFYERDGVRVPENFTIQVQKNLNSFANERGGRGPTDVIKLNLGGFLEEQAEEEITQVQKAVARRNTADAVQKYRNSREYNAIMEKIENLIDNTQVDTNNFEIDIAGHSLGGFKARVLTSDIKALLINKNLPNVKVRGKGFNAFIREADGLPELNPTVNRPSRSRGGGEIEMQTMNNRRRANTGDEETSSLLEQETKITDQETKITDPEILGRIERARQQLLENTETKVASMTTDQIRKAREQGKSEAVRDEIRNQRGDRQASATKQNMERQLENLKSLRRAEMAKEGGLDFVTEPGDDPTGRENEVPIDQFIRNKKTLTNRVGKGPVKEEDIQELEVKLAETGPEGKKRANTDENADEESKLLEDELEEIPLSDEPRQTGRRFDPDEVENIPAEFEHHNIRTDPIRADQNFRLAEARKGNPTFSYPDHPSYGKGYGRSRLTNFNDIQFLNRVDENAPGPRALVEPSIAGPHSVRQFFDANVDLVNPARQMAQPEPGMPVDRSMRHVTERNNNGEIVQEFRNPTLTERVQNVTESVSNPVTRASALSTAGGYLYSTGEGLASGYLGGVVVDAIDPGRSEKKDFGDQAVSTAELSGATTLFAQGFKGLRSAVQTGIEGAGLSEGATPYLESAAAGAAEGLLPTAAGITAGLAAGKLATAGSEFIGDNVVTQVNDWTGHDHDLSKREKDYISVTSDVVGGATAGAVGTYVTVLTGAALTSAVTGAEIGSAILPGVGTAIGAGIGAATAGVIELVKHKDDIGNFFKHLF